MIYCAVLLEGDVCNIWQPTENLWSTQGNARQNAQVSFPLLVLIMHALFWSLGHILRITLRLDLYIYTLNLTIKPKLVHSKTLMVNKASQILPATFNTQPL